MRLIPTHCGACGKLKLVQESELVGGELPCASCGSRAVALPGQSYTAEDAALFDGFAETLGEAGLGADQAARLLRELGDIARPGSGNRVRRLVELMPSLSNLELIVVEQRIPARKADGVLLLLLAAIAERPSQSEFPEAVSMPVEDQAQ